MADDESEKYDDVSVDQRVFFQPWDAGCVKAGTSYFNGHFESDLYNFGLSGGRCIGIYSG